MGEHALYLDGLVQRFVKPVHRALTAAVPGECNAARAGRRGGGEAGEGAQSGQRHHDSVRQTNSLLLYSVLCLSCVSKPSFSNSFAQACATAWMSLMFQRRRALTRGRLWSLLDGIEHTHIQQVDFLRTHRSINTVVRSGQLQ